MNPDPLSGAPGSIAVARRPVDRRSMIVFWIGLALAVIGLAALGTAAYTYWLHRDQGAAFIAKNAHADGVVQTAAGLQYKVLSPGKGAKPTDTDVALVNYAGKLIDGTVFDQSKTPTPLPVAGMIPGFSEGLKLMPKGAKYRFWIKPELGYGDSASGPIPAHSVLVFDVELLDFLPEAVVQQLQAQAQAQQGAAEQPKP